MDGDGGERGWQMTGKGHLLTRILACNTRQWGEVHYFVRSRASMLYRVYFSKAVRLSINSDESRLLCLPGRLTVSNSQPTLTSTDKSTVDWLGLGMMPERREEAPFVCLLHCAYQVWHKAIKQALSLP